MRRYLPAILLSCTLVPAQAAHWQAAEDSRFGFAVPIEGVNTSGQFRRFDIDLDFDPAATEAAQLRVTVDLRAADMGDPDMNAVLFDPAWFDTVQFATAVFESTSIYATEQGYVASGTLELKGITKVIDVPFTWQACGGAAAMQGSLILQRGDFNVGSGDWAGDETIGVDVNLEFALQLRRTE